MTPMNPPSLFDVDAVRAQFPALAREVNGRQAIYLDGPAGSQVPGRVIDAVAGYLANTNANHDGVFATSRESDALLAAAHRGLADFVGSDDPDCVVFGANMTSLTFALSRALARTWQPGDEVVVTRLSHDANFTPWSLAASDAGATLRVVDFRTDDCTLDIEALARALNEKTRLVAVGCACNATGTINPIGRIVELAHEAGARVFLDAVHYAPHALIDVAAWGCDFLACSAYKFFGPHVGVLWGRRDLLTSLPAYRVRPSPTCAPGRWMTGTQNHEGIAGTLAAVDYLAELGRTLDATAVDRRAALAVAYRAIVDYERELCRQLIAGLCAIPGVHVWGITDPDRFAERVPTVSITHDRLSPRELAEKLAEQAVFVWHGNFYALPVTEHLGLEPDGMVRIGLLHYNTREEIARLLEAIAQVG
jgi:cysteine desulfurase family protein (TIGR01976 family)